ncbi:MAG: ribosome silencing factor [Muribaculaceae bacterium]|nr:ribosome silencing factor [Muribaculaceae bacterium]MDE6559582.1 ribosome silencing factor [Muribaculaceae bacterium]
MQNSNDLKSTIIEAIYDKKGQKITLIDLSKIESAPTMEMIICQARSSAQVGAIADNIIDEVSKKLHIKPYATDGFRNSQWIIVDYGNIMVHVFQPEIREFYHLEELWSDGETTDLPNLD